MGSLRGKPDSLQSPKTKLIQADNSPVIRGKDYRGDTEKNNKKHPLCPSKFGFHMHAQKTLLCSKTWNG